MLIYSTYNNHYSEISFEPDAYELRLDLCKDQFLIPEFFYKKNTILTLRDASEGGNYKGCIKKKLNFYLDILKNTSFFVDIEVKYLDNCQEFDSFYDRIIWSQHCNLNVPTTTVPIQKYVYPIDTLLEQCKLSNKYFCLLSSGKTSLISRLLYKHFGSKAVYFGKEGYETAAGQLTDNDVLLYNLKTINKETIIGGILGGEQIINSIGLKFYNNYFKQNNINAVYLPFINPDLNDFISFVKDSGFRFYGFSITMPYKKKLSELLKIDKEIINLWIPSSNEVDCTDETAFIQAFSILDITKDTPIILYGKGAMAQIVKKLLPDNIIYSVARDNIVPDIDKNIPVAVINATPQIDLIPNNLLIHSVIDLPYSNNSTAIIDYCIENNVPHIDGVSFWKIQAEKQLYAFCDNMYTTSGRRGGTIV